MKRAALLALLALLAACVAATVHRWPGSSPKAHGLVGAVDRLRVAVDHHAAAVAALAVTVERLRKELTSAPSEGRKKWE